MYCACWAVKLFGGFDCGLRYRRGFWTWFGWFVWLLVVLDLWTWAVLRV